MVMNLRFRAKLSNKIRDLRGSEILKSRILKWLIMIKKFLLAMESVTEELTMGMQSKCKTSILTIHLRGAVQKTQLIVSSHSRTYGETSFIEGIDEHTPLIQRENELNDSVDEIKRKSPKADTSKFTSKIDKFGRVHVRLIRKGGKDYLLFNEYGELNKKELPEKIINALGPPAEDIVETNREEMTRREKKIQELQASRETSENQRVQIDADIEEQQNEISRLETENERIEVRMSLRDRVKLIFKKYGFTVFAVVSAVGLVIGVVVSNLKKGLTSLGKGVGGALKNIGKKIGEILPGMIGAIASFVFKTAGEAVGFLAKNAWLLILAAVMFMIEKFKK